MSQWRNLLILICSGLLMSGSAQPLENFSFEVNETQPGKSVLYYSRGETYRTLAPETLFKVYVGARDYDLPPVAGQYVVDREKIIFQPFYDWSEGQVYSAVNESGEVFQFQIPKRNSELPKLLGIFPSSDTLPANQLKLYLRFSAPMASGMAYQAVEITDDSGAKLEEPFLNLEPELWDLSRTQLTLWFDPGRLKRDLNPNKDLGTPLEAGRSYSIKVLPIWENIRGQTLEAEFEKTIHIIEADREKPTVESWQLELPPGDQRALKIHFGESLDYVLGMNCLRVVDEWNKELEGMIWLESRESTWCFEPSSLWKKGKYRIRVDAKFEDLAGNNLNRLFDRDLTDHRQTLGSEDYYWLEFELK